MGLFPIRFPLKISLSGSVSLFDFISNICRWVLIKMPPLFFPLRWESTGEQWWYATPIDWAAANGFYDIVRELLHLDPNLLIKLTSLRRIRRLETVWDDEAQFEDVAKSRSYVARKLLLEGELKGGKNSLIRAGYGGWLLYTAASAGDMDFVMELLEKDPLLVFGEGEYGVTDILYAAARSKNCEAFKLLLDFALSLRCCPSPGEGTMEESSESEMEMPSAFRWEMMNRAIHCAARGGNLVIMTELIGDCPDVLIYRDAQGSTILHTAAARGQIEVRSWSFVFFLFLSKTMLSFLCSIGLHRFSSCYRLFLITVLAGSEESGGFL